ncbi:unnamed protein product, partial [Mesorhabditis belari]|uniref:Neurotransmitter-gated ion-channel ligand-binding domain-containing protein n=1 Tax=Mesorhabditis belari TaxID=2138241 RepID=A0AAF3EGQ6_9BILA
MTFALCGDILSTLGRPIYFPSLYTIVYSSTILSIHTKAMGIFAFAFTLTLVHGFLTISGSLGFYKLRLVYIEYKRVLWIAQFSFLACVAAKEFLNWCTAYDLYFNGQCTDDPKVLCAANGMSSFCDYDLPYILQCTPTTAGTRVWIAIGVAMALLGGTLTAICVLVTYEAFHPKQNISRKTLEMQRYFNTVYLAQNQISVLVSTPVVLAVAMILQLITNDLLVAIASLWELGMNFHSIAINLLVIFSSKTYRRVIFGIFLNILLLDKVLSAQRYRNSSNDEDYQQYGVTGEYSQFINSAHDLYKELFTRRDYQMFLAPINSKVTRSALDSEKFEITVAIQRLMVLSVDMARQTMEMYFELEMSWTDIRLAWDSQEFDDIEILYVHCDALWAPEEFLVMSPTINEGLPQRFKQCKLYANGSVHFDMFMQIENICPMNIQKFPFDSQTCLVDFSSLQYEFYQLNLKPGLFTKYQGKQLKSNGEWTITNTSSSIEHYDYGLEGKSFDMEEQLEKLAIALTSMMSMTTFVQMVSEQMPKTSQFPLLGIFVLTCVFITSVACVSLIVFAEKCKKHRKEETSLMERIKLHVKSTHFAFFVLFQGANIINFIVFLSFWN